MNWTDTSAGLRLLSLRCNVSLLRTAGDQAFAELKNVSLGNALKIYNHPTEALKVK